MNRLVFVWLISGLLVIATLFQNCSGFKPELNASSNYSVGAESLSNDGNGELSNSQISLLQNSAPVVSSSAKNIDRSSEPSFIFSMNNTALDAHVSFNCRLDGGEWYRCSSPTKITNIIDGNHNLTIKANYRNFESMPKEVVWKKDTQPPSLTINSPPPNFIGATFVEINFSSSDSGSGVSELTCQLNEGESSPCLSPLLLTDLVEGNYTLKIRASDSAGNTNEISRSWTVDFNAAYISLSQKPNEYTTATSARFEFAVQNSDDYTIYECQFDAEPIFQTCQSGMTYVLSGERQYTFQVRAKNGDGFYTSTLSYTFFRDVSAPMITLLSPLEFSQEKNSFIFNFSVSDGMVGVSIDTGKATEYGVGVESVSCVLNSTILGATSSRKIDPCESPLDLSTELTGQYEISVTASDKLGHINTSKYFTFYYVNEEKDVPFITLNLAGGAVLAANVIPLNQNAELLANYAKLGMGTTSNVEDNTENYMGARWYKNSGMLAGIKGILTDIASSKARVYAIPVQTTDNTASNPLDVQMYVMQAGLQGTYFRNAALSATNGNGINQSLIFENDGNLSIPLNPLYIYGSGISTTQETLYGQLSDVPFIEAFEISAEANIKSLYGVEETSSISLRNLAAGVYNSVNGNSGPLGINLSGYDYPGTSRLSSDAKDRTAGEYVARALQHAYNSNKKLMIYVTTDGSASSSSDPSSGGGNWTSDSGKSGQLLVFAIDPNNGFSTSNFGSDYMIGSFVSDTQGADNTFWSHNDDRVSAREMAALSVVANYLAFTGKRPLIPQVTNGLISEQNIDKYVRIKQSP